MAPISARIAKQRSLKTNLLRPLKRPGFRSNPVSRPGEANYNAVGAVINKTAGVLIRGLRTTQELSFNTWLISLLVKYLVRRSAAI
jgi:hypothetical protein